MSNPGGSKRNGATKIRLTSKWKKRPTHAPRDPAFILFATSRVSVWVHWCKIGCFFWLGELVSTFERPFESPHGTRWCQPLNIEYAKATRDNGRNSLSSMLSETFFLRIAKKFAKTTEILLNLFCLFLFVFVSKHSRFWLLSDKIQFKFELFKNFESWFLKI